MLLEGWQPRLTSRTVNKTTLNTRYTRRRPISCSKKTTVDAGHLVDLAAGNRAERGTGGYGVGLARAVRRAGHRVVEVNRADRRLRRVAGKSDRIDAEAAARSVLAGQATATPKTADGAVEMIRQLKVARDTAVKARTAAMNTLKQISYALELTVRFERREFPDGRPGTGGIVHRRIPRRPRPPARPVAGPRLRSA